MVASALFIPFHLFPGSQGLPQVADTNTPRQMDVAGECLE
jgi:hypothetical protein